MTPLENGFSAQPDQADTRSPYSSPNLGAQALDDTYYAITRGTPTTPDLRSEPIFALKKISANTETDNSQNAVLVLLGEKRTSAGSTRLQGLFSEVVDYAGWDGAGGNNFIEGLRSHAIIKSTAGNGSGYGSILFAGAEAGANWKYLIGAEGDVGNSTTDAPRARDFDRGHFSAAFLATSRGTKKNDAAFLSNPFNNVPFRTGFLVGETSVDHAAFVSRAATVYGLDLGLGTQSFSAIRIPNNTAMHARSAGGAVDLNILYVSTGDQLVLGQGANGLQVHTSDMLSLTARTVTMGAPDSGGAGFRALRVPNT